MPDNLIPIDLRKLTAEKHSPVARVAAAAASSQPVGAAIDAAVKLAGDLIRSYTEITIAREHEITERQRIRAMLTAKLEELHLRHEEVKISLAERRAHRDQLLTEYRNYMNQAIQQNNMELAEIIASLYKVFMIS